MTQPTRVVVIGEPAEAGLRDSLVHAFRSCECSVAVRSLGPWRPGWLSSAAHRQPLLGAGFRRTFRRQVDALADQGPFDLVLVVKGAFLNSQSIDHLRSHLGGPVACWNPDSPFDDAISNRGAGIPRAIAAYDVYITWADDIAERLRPVAAQVLVVPFAWDPAVIKPTPGHGEATRRVAFIGTATRQRSALLQRLAYLRPIVFGAGWPHLDGLDIRPPVRGIEFSRIVGEAKWNLNLLRPQNAHSHNMRSFELVGAGGTQVAPATDDHERFLSGDGRTVLFRDERELEAILRSDPSDLPARSPTVLDGHTYASRAQTVLVRLGLRHD
jgi:hypothetical protein